MGSDNIESSMYYYDKLPTVKVMGLVSYFVVLFQEFHKFVHVIYAMRSRNPVLKRWPGMLKLSARSIINVSDDSLREAMYPVHTEQSRSLEHEDKRHKNKVDGEARSQSLECDLQRTPVNTQQCLTDIYKQKGKPSFQRISDSKCNESVGTPLSVLLTAMPFVNDTC